MRAAALGLRDGDRDELEAWLRSSTIRAGLAKRARIVLLAADGLANAEIARTVGMSVPTVRAWRDRYARSGTEGLGDAPRSGRPKQVDDRAIVEATLRPPPKRLGVTHWSSRLLAARLKIDHATVARAWKAYGVQPWRCETFKFSTDPELAAKVTDVVGLYLAPPRNAVVLCVEEKSQIQALDRTAPMLALQPGLPNGAPMTTAGTAPPPCSPPWRSRPERSPPRASPATGTRSSSPSSSRLPAPTPTGSCTW